MFIYQDVSHLCWAIYAIFFCIFCTLIYVCYKIKKYFQRNTEHGDLPRNTIITKQDEWLSDSIQRLADGSVPVYECQCQGEPRFCLEIKRQDVNKFVKELKQVSKPHTAEKEEPQVSQHQEATFRGHISLDQEELNALHYFDKDFITSNFTEEHEAQEAITGSVGVFLRPKTAEYAQKLESLRNSLRKEDIILSSNEFETFIQSFDSSSTDLGVFMVPNREECKVTVYAMNYEAMTKAKHVVSVKSGKIKTTLRDQRKFNTIFDSIALASDTGDSQQKFVSDVTRNHTKGMRLPSEKTRYAGEIDNKGDESHHPLPSIPVDYVTESGIQVSVYKADITQLTVDAIVNAANGHLQHGGGVAAVIARTAGADLELEGYDYVRRHGPLSVTQVVPTTAGILPCKKVFHAIGPRWNDYQDKDTCLLHLEQTVFNSLKTAHDLKFSSTAVSSISSAIFGVPKDLCARMYLAAVQRFDKHLGSSSSLRRVHFVDVNDEMVGLIQKTFTDNWSVVITPPSAQQFDLENETNLHSLKSTSSKMQSQTSNCNSSEQEIIQNGDDLSKQRENLQNSSCPSVKNSSSPPPNKPQNPYQFRLQNLDLNFSQNTVEDSNAEALVFWQGPGEFSSEHLQNAKIPPSEIEQLRKKLKTKKIAVSTLPTKIVIVISIPSITRDKVREIIGEVLNVVHQNKKETISILVSCDKASSNDLQEMSTGLYLAVQKYSEKKKQIKEKQIKEKKIKEKKIREIHVLNSNADSLKIMADILQTVDSKSFT